MLVGVMKLKVYLEIHSTMYINYVCVCNIIFIHNVQNVDVCILQFS